MENRESDAIAPVAGTTEPVSTQESQPCPECGKIVTKTGVSSLRALMSSHRRAVHGWRSPNPRSPHGSPAERRKARLEYQKRYREQHKGMPATTTGNATIAPKQHEAVPCKLSECPACGARFYVAKGGLA